MSETDYTRHLDRAKSMLNAAAGAAEQAVRAAMRAGAEVEPQGQFGEHAAIAQKIAGTARGLHELRAELGVLGRGTVPEPQGAAIARTEGEQAAPPQPQAQGLGRAEIGGARR